MVRKCKGGKSLRQLSQEMWEWEVKAYQSRPPGAVFRVPRRMSTQTIAQRDLLPHNLVLRVLLTRYLNRFGLKSLKTVKVPFLSQKHTQARLKFAKDNMALDWMKVCPCGLVLVVDPSLSP